MSAWCCWAHITSSDALSSRLAGLHPARGRPGGDRGLQVVSSTRALIACARPVAVLLTPTCCDAQGVSVFSIKPASVELQSSRACTLHQVSHRGSNTSAVYIYRRRLFYHLSRLLVFVSAPSHMRTRASAPFQHMRQSQALSSVLILPCSAQLVAGRQRHRWYHRAPATMPYPGGGHQGKGRGPGAPTLPPHRHTVAHQSPSSSQA